MTTQRKTAVAGKGMARLETEISQRKESPQKDIETSALEPPPLIEAAPVPGRVFIVVRPVDWTPKNALDLPPNVELHNELDSDSAKAFAIGFNEEALSLNHGHWALV